MSTALAPERADARSDAPVTAQSPHRGRRTVAAVTVLVAVYLVLAALHNPRGYLVSDVGGRVATVRSLARSHGTTPDLGYWAQRFDPAGKLMPFGNAVKTPRGWVTAGSLVTIYAAYPLWQLGGYPAMLLLPIAGAVLAALAARRLAQLLAPGDSGWPAFWLVGLASPVLIDGLDFWDHTLGLALVAWAAVLAVQLSRQDAPRARTYLAAGLLLGTAATLRTEAFVYGAVVGLAILVARWVRTRRLAPVLLGVGALGAGALVPLVANDLFERAVLGGSLRAGRTAGYGDTGFLLHRRIVTAMVTAFGLHANETTAALVLGVALTALLVVAVRTGARDPRLALIALAGCVMLFWTRFGDGLGFVPGLVPTTPLVVLGVVAGWREPRWRPLVIAALLAAPLVWASQYPGGEVPVWGARYLLPTGLALGVVGALALRSTARLVAVGLVAVSAAVTVYGVAWMVQRSSVVASTGASVGRVHDDVLVASDGQFFTELGGFWTGQHWLHASTHAQLDQVASIAQRTGARRVGVIDRAEARPVALSGYCISGHTPIRWFGGADRLVITQYAPAGSTACTSSR